MEYRGHVKNHNYRIKEHDISTLDTKSEIILTMFIHFFSCRRQLRLKLHGAPLIMWRSSRNVDFSLTFLHSNSICHMCSAPALGVGVTGRHVYFFFHFQDNYHELLFPQGATAEVWWNTGDT